MMLTVLLIVQTIIAPVLLLVSLIPVPFKVARFVYLACGLVVLAERTLAVLQTFLLCCSKLHVTVF